MNTSGDESSGDGYIGRWVHRAMGTSLKSVSRASGIVNLHFLYATLGDEEVSAEIVDRRRQRCVEAGVEAPAEAK